MKKKFLAGFIMVFFALMAAGCGQEEDRMQSIAVEPVEEFEKEPEEKPVEESARESVEEYDREPAKEPAKENDAEHGSKKTGTGETAESPWKEAVNEERSAYYAVVEKLYTTYTLSDGTELGYGDAMDLSENKFAICDIDRDGKEELVILWTTTYTAGMAGIIYGFDSASGAVKTELLEFPAQTFYDNGIVRVELSHNHGLAGNIDDFWPHTFYQYDKESDAYVVIAEVDAWNKEYYELDYDGTPFPGDVDVDGDGILYRVTIGDSEKLMDLEEYDKWQDSVIGTAKKVEIPFVDMAEENFKTILGL